MNQTASIAASLPPEHRKNLALIVLAKNEPLTNLAAREKVSRRFLYRQKSKATNALNQAFSPISNNQSECPERVGKSPTELLTGKPHPHWLELLGFDRFRRSVIAA